MSSNIDSILDKIYVEFYDVLDESAFDPSSSYKNTKNLKLLGHKGVYIREIPFNEIGLASEFTVEVELDND
jgi:hypothetical protein